MRAAAGMIAGTALVVSFGLHMVGFTMLTSTRAPIEIEGGAPSQVAMLGNSFADMTEGTTSPVATVETTEKPVEVEPAKAPQPEITPPTIPTHSALAVFANSRNPVVPVMAITPTMPQEALKSEAPVEVQQAKPETQRPVTRPAKPTAAHPKPTTTPRKPATAAPPKRQGGAQTTRKGQADGKADGQVANSGQGSAKARAAGNAAASNYPGLVMRKISRVRKQRAGARGKAIVGFKISASGAATSVRIIRSSGSAKIDRVALRHIQRASPFPRPPKGARRNFSVEFVSKG